MTAMSNPEPPRAMPELATTVEELVRDSEVFAETHEVPPPSPTAANQTTLDAIAEAKAGNTTPTSLDDL